MAVMIFGRVVLSARMLAVRRGMQAGNARVVRWLEAIVSRQCGNRLQQDCEGRMTVIAGIPDLLRSSWPS